MRFVGRITSWNEDKGYGFVVPHDGGARSFVHIKAFQSGSRRPVEGDLVSYSSSTDDRGRINAMDVRFAGQNIVQRKPGKPLPRVALGAGFLLAASGGTLLDLVPALVTIGYGLVSGVSYLIYSLDKAAAGKDMQRTPESTLHLVDLLGGWPGALIAQQQFRHKTVKASFQAAFWATVSVNVAVVAWLIHSGIADSLTASLLGG